MPTGSMATTPGTFRWLREVRNNLQDGLTYLSMKEAPSWWRCSASASARCAAGGRVFDSGGTSTIASLPVNSRTSRWIREIATAMPRTKLTARKMKARAPTRDSIIGGSQRPAGPFPQAGPPVVAACGDPVQGEGRNQAGSSVVVQRRQPFGFGDVVHGVGVEERVERRHGPCHGGQLIARGPAVDLPDILDHQRVAELFA